MATRGGGESGCATVTDPDGCVDVEIVMGLVSALLTELLPGCVAWFKNMGTNCGPSLAVACRFWSSSW